MHRRHLIALIGLFAAGSALAQPPGPEVSPPPAGPPAAMGQTVRVALETGEGRIVLELYPDKAPITVANFLHYADQHRYNGAHFFRAARAPGAPTFGLVQGGGFTDASKLFKPITLEPTSQTGLRHHDGTISMARDKPNSAMADFFIAVGDAPYLDADPTQPGDNLGYAAFGQVVEGMEVVRKILAAPTDGPARNPIMQGQILTTPVPIISAKRVN